MKVNQQGVLRVLASEEWTRRNFLKMATMAVGAAALPFAPAMASEDLVKHATEAAKPAGKLGDSLFFFGWSNTINTDNMQAFTTATGARVQVSTFDSVESAIAKLEIAKETAGYDLFVVGDAYVKSVIDRKLVQPLDHSLLPNLANLGDAARNASYDPGNKYTVLKYGGTEGFLYNKEVIKEDLRSWDDFFRVAAMPEVSGKVSVLNDSPSVLGLVFWREGKDYNTGDPEKLNRAKEILIKELAPHIKDFTARPIQGLLSGDFVLSQGYNGNSRHIFEQDPSRFAWVFPTPQCVGWSDNWSIPVGAKNVAAAHAWINYMLDPIVSAGEAAFNGYDTGVKGVIDAIPDSVVRKDIIVITPEVQARLVGQTLDGVNASLREQIYNEVKAAASRG
ncbi:spermidine/putrescine ABC transporter substrate-binding protein [Mesorhizobium sp.]|uniref:ABC transporter substrate-binding protein n=1 Tax=Mesorhizobium sp. TaxID=1871066 RepID=UPI000FE62832|nr:spermidine/putrescine ABC transporter substrate-binding protein [Mesorhizobium sp.]RWI88951.1 MAG: spermidine/putrescine ABC transporter substrate-binding protein [Mesorhizobium sp.]